MGKNSYGSLMQEWIDDLKETHDLMNSHCPKDYKGKHRFEKLGVDNNKLIYQCSQCKQCVREELLFLLPTQKVQK